MHAVVPLHLSGRGGEDQERTPTDGSSFRFIPDWLIIPFEKLTIANMSADNDNIFWLHAIWVYVFVIYSLWLLRMHYEVRQLLQVSNSWLLHSSYCDEMN